MMRPNERSAMFDPARLPPPDAMGFFSHPDLPETDEGQSIVPLIDEMGFESAFVSMDYNAPEDLLDAWYERGDMAAPTRWEPTPPQGGGWQLVAKYDTESGPYAMFVRPRVEVLGNESDRMDGRVLP